MDFEAEGVFWRLVRLQWENGSVPADNRAVAALLGKPCSMDALEAALACFPACAGGRRQNGALADLREREMVRERLRSAAGRRGGTVSGAVRRAKPSAPAPKPKRETWITPFYEAWQRQYDAKPNARQMASAFRPLLERATPDDVLRAFERYVSETEARFASPSRFAQTFGHWSGTAAPVRAKNGQERSFENIDRGLFGEPA